MSVKRDPHPHGWRGQGTAGGSEGGSGDPTRQTPARRWDEGGGDPASGARRDPPGQTPEAPLCETKRPLSGRSAFLRSKVARRTDKGREEKQCGAEWGLPWRGTNPACWAPPSSARLAGVCRGGRLLRCAPRRALPPPCLV